MTNLNFPKLSVNGLSSSSSCEKATKFGVLLVSSICAIVTEKVFETPALMCLHKSLLESFNCLHESCLMIHIAEAVDDSCMKTV